MMNITKRIHLPPFFFRVLVVFGLLSSGIVQAQDKLDMSFIQGGASINSDEWDVLNSTYAPGRYLVDLSLNGKGLGKQILDVTPQDSEALCLSSIWLKKAGVNIRTEYFKDGYDVARKCHVLTKGQAVKVDFDVSTQSLALTLPQQSLKHQREDLEWDYGANALRINYNLNASKGQNNTGFGSADLKANVGRWVLNSTASGSAGESGNRIDIAMFTASRAIRTLSADLVIGKNQVGTGLLGSVGTYGASITHNNSMSPRSIGYRPVFSGIANDYARITLAQGKNALYSEMVPPGPFSVTDLVVYGSGDVTLTVNEVNGRTHSQIFPVAVMAGQLSSGEYEFSVSAGVADEDSDLKRGLMSASYSYGLGKITLRTGSVWHQRYLGYNGGMTTGLGMLGSVSAEGARAVRKYELRSSQSGSKVQLAWNKHLETTRTGLRISWSRALTEEFPDLSGFNPADLPGVNTAKRNIRDEWNIGGSQSIGRLFSLSLLGWKRSYYNDHGIGQGLTGTLSAQMQGVSLNLGGSGSKDTKGQPQWAVSASLSIPFSLFEQRYSSSTTISTTKGGGVDINSGISGNLDDSISWGISGGRNSNGGRSSALNMNYIGEWATLGGSLSQSSSGGIYGSFSLNGSVLSVPATRSVMFSRITSDSVAVVSVKDTMGVRTSSSNGQTNQRGNLVLPLNSYEMNTVTIDASSLPLDTELGYTSRQVVPSGQAVVLMPFDALKVRRYLLQVRLVSGEFVPGGTWAKDENGTPLGFVANNGVLMLNIMDPLGTIILGECVISAKRLEETVRLQEISCDNT